MSIPKTRYKAKTAKQRRKISTDAAKRGSNAAIMNAMDAKRYGAKRPEMAKRAGRAAKRAADEARMAKKAANETVEMSRGGLCRGGGAASRGMKYSRG